MSKQCAEHKNEMPCRECGNAVMNAILPPATRVAIEKRRRIGQEWDKIANQDNLSDEEALILVAKNAGVTYGEARDVLCAGWPPQHLPAHS